MPCVYSKLIVHGKTPKICANVNSSSLSHNEQVWLIKLFTLTLQVLTAIALFHKAHMKPTSFLLRILHQMFIHFGLKVKGRTPTHLFSNTLFFGLESLNIFLPNAVVKENKGSSTFPLIGTMVRF